MHRVLLVLSLAVLLGSCAAQFMAAAERECQAFGYPIGTSQYAGCVEQQYNQRVAAMQRAGQALSAAGAAGQQTYSAPAPNYSSPATMTCFYQSEITSGFNKICSYNCLGSAYAVTQSATSLCAQTLSR